MRSIEHSDPADRARSEAQLPILREWRGGLDVVRLAAMAAIAVQHLMAVSGYHTPPLFFHLDLGHIGVAAFCSISGYLAFSVSREKPHSWFVKRFKRIYVPFWMCVVLVFVANALIPYRPVSFGLFLAEMSGFGFFVYPTQLLGIHFWFVSLILVCYIAAFIIRVAPQLTVVVVVLALVALHTLPPEISGNLLAFLAAGWLAHIRRERFASIGIILASCGLAIWYHHAWASVSAGTSALLLGLVIFPGYLGRVHTLSLLSYEFYLVHAPVYFALRKISGLGILGNAIIGTATSIVGAWLLSVAAARIFRLPAYRRLLRRRRNAGSLPRTRVGRN